MFLYFWTFTAPRIKLTRVIKRIVTVNILDSDDFRSKIDGYVATLHTPGERGRIFQNLPVNTKEFTYDELAVGKRYVIEVTAYREKLSSKPSNSVIIKTKTPGNAKKPAHFVVSHFCEL